MIAQGRHGSLAFARQPLELASHGARAASSAGGDEDSRPLMTRFDAVGERLTS